MTDIDYEKLNKTIHKIITNTSLLVEGIEIKGLTILKEKLGLVKSIISDVSKINECCEQSSEALNPLMMMMLTSQMASQTKGLSITDKEELWEKIGKKMFPDKKE